MPSLLKIAGLPALVLAVCAAAAAETGRHYSLTEAVDQAFRANHQYRSTLNGVALAELDLEAAEAEFRPQFYSSVDSDARTGSMIGSTYQLGVTRKTETGSAFGVGFRNSTFNGDALSELRFSYSLPFFKDPVQTGRFGLERAELDFRHRQRVADIAGGELVLQVASSYYGLALAGEQIAVARGELALAQKLLLATRLRRRTGRSNELDLRWAELRVQQAARGLETARLRRERAEDELKMVLGIDLATPVEVDADIPLPQVADALELSVEDAEARALRNRADLASLAEDMQMAERRLRQRRSRVLPEVDIRLHYALVGEGDAFDDSLELDDTRFGVGVSVNLGGNAAADREGRRLALYFEEKRNAYRRLEDQIRSRVREAVFGLGESASALAIARETLELARRQFEFTELKYGAGNATTQEVLEAQQALTDARHRELAARVTCLLAGYRLDLATGTLLERHRSEGGFRS